jgi:hypothetical protein
MSRSRGFALRNGSCLFLGDVNETQPWARRYRDLIAGHVSDLDRAFFEQPLLAQLVRRHMADSIELTNNIAIEITTNDRRRVRGRTVICAILDEVAH